jgi:methylmalonyl-CoA epimerase
MIERILEIGVAVYNVDAARSPFTEILQATPGDIIIDKEYYDMRMQMCRVGNIDFELMESIDDRNVIGRFLKRRGPGLHHIAFQVSDILSIMEWLKKNNIWIVTDPPVQMENLSAIFIHPKSFHGVMFEFIKGVHHWVEGKELPADLRTNGKGGNRFLFQGITEIGVAVNDLEVSTEVYKRVLGASVSEKISIDLYKMLMRVCRIGNVNFKLMRSVSSDGVIAKFIKKRGQGLHHVTLQVSDLDDAVNWMRQRKVELISQSPEVIWGTRSVFVHPKSFGGVMLELSEGQHDWFAGG